MVIGFLPSEDETGRGQGYFPYLIKPKKDLPNGTEIRNVAGIQFDFQETITTNQIDPHDPSQGTDPNLECLNTIYTGEPFPTSPLGVATKEKAEPDHANTTGNHSLWWRLNPPVNGIIFIDTLGSGFDTALAVYTGDTVRALTEVSANDDVNELFKESQVYFAGVTNVPYYVAVDGYNVNTSGSAVINVSYTDAIPADVKHDGNVNLVDLVMILQVTTGTQSLQDVYTDSDVNGDNMIVLPEASAVLQATLSYVNPERT